MTEELILIPKNQLEHWKAVFCNKTRWLDQEECQKVSQEMQKAIDNPLKIDEAIKYFSKPKIGYFTDKGEFVDTSEMTIHDYIKNKTPLREWAGGILDARLLKAFVFKLKE